MHSRFHSSGSLGGARPRHSSPRNSLCGKTVSSYQKNLRLRGLRQSRVWPCQPLDNPVKRSSPASCVPSGSPPVIPFLLPPTLLRYTHPMGILRRLSRWMGKQDQMTNIVAGNIAPGFSLKALDNKEYSLNTLMERGPVVAAFFKVSCPVCEFTFPFLERLHKRY